MRHRKATVKLGRTTAHRQAMLANQACSLIEHSRIKTTLAKAKALRPIVEKLVTLGKAGTLHARRQAVAKIQQQDAVKKLFDVIAPRTATRKGGYTRIIKLGQRHSDSAPMAYIEWVDQAVVEEPTEVTTTEAKATKEAAPKKAKAPAKPKAPKKAKEASE
ncbi:MAG: 50S ribosomal protein L17 [Chthoniobacterales bacterium]